MKQEYEEKVEETSDKLDENIGSSLDQAKSIAIDAGETIIRNFLATLPSRTQNNISFVYGIPNDLRYIVLAHSTEDAIHSVLEKTVNTTSSMLEKFE